MRVYSVILVLLFSILQGFSQASYSSFNTYFDDSFAEWDIYAEEEQVGKIEMKWKLKNDWSVWNISVDGMYGTIKMKWDNNTNHWECRMNNEVIDIKTVYPRDYSEWRIQDGSKELRLRSKYKNNHEYWSVDHKNLGYIDIYTTWEGDPRDWEIDDGLADSIGPEIKIAMIFIAILHSSPKF